MPRLSTTANGAVPGVPGIRGVAKSSAHRRPGATASSSPPPPAQAVSTDVEDTDFEEETLDALEEAPLAAGPVGGLPHTVEAFGPNGELLTMQLGDDGVYRTVQTNVPPPPVSAEVDHPLLTTLRSRTNQPKAQAKRLPAYNNPYLWYMKTDGEIVYLQGDPGNRAYYEEKGYVVLRQEEVGAYTKDKTRQVPDGRGGFRKEIVQPAVRRLVLTEQRKRAELITTIRNIALKNPAVELAGDLSITPTEELEGLLKQLKGNQSINFTLLQARQRTRADDYDDDELTAGVELHSGVELERKLSAFNEARSQNQLIPTNRMNPALPGE